MIRHVALFAAVVLFCLTGCGPSPSAGPDNPPAAGPAQPAQVRVFGPAAQEMATEQKLANLVGPFQFRAVPLSTALAQLAEAGQVEFLVDWPALNGADIKADSPVTVNLPRGTLAASLERLLAAAGKGDVLDYAARQAGIQISTTEYFASHPFVRVYDIRTLITRPRSEDPDHLAEVIRTTCLPDSWAPTGNANIKVVEGLLVVTQTPAGHRLVSALLTQLATGLARPPTSQPGQAVPLFN